MKIKIFAFYFAFHSPFTIFAACNEYRMQFGNDNKNLRFLFCISLTFHYICDWYDTLSF